MSETPGALQLRLLQTVVEVAAEKNSTLVMSFPVEMLRFFDRITQPARAAEASSPGDSAEPESPPGEDGPRALTEAAEGQGGGEELRAVPASRTRLYRDSGLGQLS
ncbi:hypothetical protein Aph01nite_18960 [Acrocarpospora phusangensis]|uniref:Uncharacterized protein n=1 Tax=Acrocarpospora phusangensis TaxID=1070424 RepID=A0A919Q8R0_9ACTN|nr:hypothetical protein [Acrocarpospora phusangensis]GIH23586.1 hypothetical protein Aph01nite_18960 [Acrocarpospora phusangensis]